MPKFSPYPSAPDDLGSTGAPGPNEAESDASLTRAMEDAMTNLERLERQQMTATEAMRLETLRQYHQVREGHPRWITTSGSFPLTYAPGVSAYDPGAATSSRNPRYGYNEYITVDQDMWDNVSFRYDTVQPKKAKKEPTQLVQLVEGAEVGTMWDHIK